MEAERLGAPLDREELLRTHPDLAGELRSFFEDRDHFRRLAGPPPPGPGSLGDYEILSVSGDGGMML